MGPAGQVLLPQPPALQGFPVRHGYQWAFPNRKALNVFATKEAHDEAGSFDRHGFLVGKRSPNDACVQIDPARAIQGGRGYIDESVEKLPRQQLSRCTILAYVQKIDSAPFVRKTSQLALHFVQGKARQVGHGNSTFEWT